MCPIRVVRCAMHERWDDPAVNRRVVTALLVLAPFLCVGGYLLVLVQGGSQTVGLVIAGLALAMTLGTAAAIHWLRSQAIFAFGAVAVAVTLLAMLLSP